MLVYLRQTFYCTFYSYFLGMSSKIDRVRLLFMLYFGATMYGISAMEKLDGGCFFSKPIKSKGYSLPFHSSKFHPNSRLHPFTHNSNSRLHYDSKLHPLQTSSNFILRLHPTSSLPSLSSHRATTAPQLSFQNMLFDPKLITSGVGAAALLVFLLAALLISVAGSVLAVLLGFGRAAASPIAGVRSVPSFGFLVAVRIFGS